MNKIYLFKAMWRSTAVKFKVSAPSEEVAIKRAARQVLKMDGGEFCEDIILLGLAEIQQSKPTLGKPSPKYYPIFHPTSQASNPQTSEPDSKS